MQTEEQRNITEAEEMEKIDLVSWLQGLPELPEKVLAAVFAALCDQWQELLYLILNLLMNRFILQRLHMRHQEPNI